MYTRSYVWWGIHTPNFAVVGRTIYTRLCDFKMPHPLCSPPPRLPPPLRGSAVFGRARTRSSALPARTRRKASRRVGRARTRRGASKTPERVAPESAPERIAACWTRHTRKKKDSLRGSGGGSRKTGVFKVKWSELNLKTLPSLGLVTPGEPVGRSDL